MPCTVPKKLLQPAGTWLLSVRSDMVSIMGCAVGVEDRNTSLTQCRLPLHKQSGIVQHPLLSNARGHNHVYGGGCLCTGVRVGVGVSVDVGVGDGIGGKIREASP